MGGGSSRVSWGIIGGFGNSGGDCGCSIYGI